MEEKKKQPTKADLLKQVNELKLQEQDLKAELNDLQEEVADYRGMQNPVHLDIYSAIDAVMDEVGCVSGTGQNKHHGYKYASEHDILLSLQKAMSKHGIAIEKPNVEIIQYEYLQDRRRYHAVVKIPYILHLSRGRMPADLSDGFSNTSVTHVCIGCGEDGADKAIPKAMTMAYKYLFRQAFALPTGDDPDATENSSAPDDENQGEESNIIELDVPFGKSKAVKELGARTKWDRSEEAKKANNGKDQFLFWYCEDTEENRKKFSAWIPEKKDQIDIFKSWAKNHYGSFAAIEAFSIKYLSAHTSPTDWNDEQLAKFMIMMDENEHNTRSKFDLFYRNEWGRNEFIKNENPSNDYHEANQEYQHNEELPF